MFLYKKSIRHTVRLPRIDQEFEMTLTSRGSCGELNAQTCADRSTLRGWAPAMGPRIWCLCTSLSTLKTRKNFLQFANYLCLQCTQTNNLQPKSHVRAHLKCGSLVEAPWSPQPDTSSPSSVHLSHLLISVLQLWAQKSSIAWTCLLLPWLRKLPSLLNLCFSSTEIGLFIWEEQIFLKGHFMTVVIKIYRS